MQTRTDQLNQHRTAISNLKKEIEAKAQEYQARNQAFNAWLQAELKLDIKDNQEMHLTDILAKWSENDSKLIV